MKRRDFLKNMAITMGGPIMLNGLGLSTIGRSLLLNGMDEDSDRVLVLVQLNGGNDGLSTLVPLDQYDKLANARSVLLIPEFDLIPLADTLAFHPRLTGLKSLYDDARLGIVQSVGYPNQNRSHFRSIEIWASGSPPDEIWNTGWMGRLLDQEASGYPTGYPNAENPDPFAISMGFLVSETCQGSASNFAVTLDDPFSPSNLAEWSGNEYDGTLYGSEYQFVREAISTTNQYSQRIFDAASVGANSVQYPDTNLAQQLKNVALLISGGLKTKIYTVTLGGFDTHSSQVSSGSPKFGTHADLLEILSGAIKAFDDDIKAQGLSDRVVGMTFSEFGRQIRENGSLGTDHGTAAPLILFGGCADGKILGDNPVIPDNVGPQDGVPMQFDFRDVYGSVLMDWFGVSESNVKNLLYAGFTYLPVLEGCSIAPSSSSEVRQAPVIELQSFPNPFSDTTRIRFFGNGGWLRLSVFNAMGQELKVLAEGHYSPGSHEVDFSARGLPAGNYYCRIQTREGQKTALMVKV